MPAAYPKVFRDKVVAAYHRGEGSFATIGARFGIGEATVNRWVSLARKTGSVEPRKMGGARRERTVTPEGEDFVRRLIAEEPTATLPQMAEAYFGAFGIEVNSRMMGDTLRRLGITKKKRFVGRPRRPVLMWCDDERSGTPR